MVQPAESISAFILAGGKSSRMGEEKGLVLFRGKPLIQYLLEVLSELDFQPTIIGQHPGYQRFGVSVIEDLIPEKGPLGGIYTSLFHTQFSRALILSCDSPLIGSATLLKFISQAEKDLAIGILEDRIYPFPGIYPKTILPQLSKNLASNELRVQRFITQQDHHLISLEKISSHPKEEFSNFNRPEELTLWEKKEECLKSG